MPSSLDYLLPLGALPPSSLEKLEQIKAERKLWLERPHIGHQVHFLSQLPNPTHVSCNFSQDVVTIGRPEEISMGERNHLIASLKQLIPWRKGPFSLFGIEIDAEWRSEQKWQRIPELLKENLREKVVLDIGCNNGYFMLKMAEYHPKLILGIDPVCHNYLQFSILQHFCKIPFLHFELFEVAHLPLFPKFFDTIFSMGILYHHRNPIEQLEWIREALKPDGQLILETMGIPGEDSICLFPEGAYTKMRNTWFVPTLPCLLNWLRKAHFNDIVIHSISQTTSGEQRTTPWCPPPRQSYADFIDPQDHTKTIEGYPAPLRFCLSARKPSQ